MKTAIEIKHELVDGLNAMYQEFTGTLEQFSDKQINQVPFEGSWTPGQVADHIIKATGGIPDQHTDVPNRVYNEKTGAIDSMFLDFTTKFKSPPFVVPGNGPFVKAELTGTLKGLAEKHKQKINETDLTMLCLKFELPLIGTMTRYEWYRFMLAHGKRHLFQLKNILAAMASAETS